MTGGFTGTGNLTLTSTDNGTSIGSPITVSGGAINMVGTLSFNNPSAKTLNAGVLDTIGANIGSNVTTVTLTDPSTQVPVVLSGNNMFTGGLTLASGTLDINSATALGAAAGTFAITAGTLDNTSGAAITNSNNNPINLHSFTFTGSNALNLGTGAVTMAAATTITANSAANPLTIGGAIGGAFALTKAGTGTVILSGTNTYTGVTNITGGKLILAGRCIAGKHRHRVASGATFSAQPGSASNSAGGSLTLNAGSAFDMVDNAIGTFNLTGTGTALTVGASSGTAPSLTFEIGNAATGTDRLAVTNAATVAATGGTISIGALAGDTTLTPGDYTLISASSGLGVSGLTLASSTITVGSTTYNLSLANSTSTSEILTVGGATGAAGSAQWDFNGNGNFSQFVKWSPRQVPSGVGQTATFGNGVSTTINAAAPTITVDNAYTLGTVAFTNTNGSAYVIAGDGVAGHGLTLDGGGSGANVTVATGVTATQTISAPVTLNDNLRVTPQTSTTLAISGSIGQNSSAKSLTMNGGGTLILSGASNSYTGGTTVSAGVLANGVLNALPTSTALTVKGTGTYNLSGKSQTVGSLADGGVNTGIITNTSGTAATFTINNSSLNTFSGAVNGNLALTMAGSGGLTLTGTSGYTGTTSINAGLLLVHGALNGGGAVHVGDATEANGYQGALAGNGTITGSVFVHNGSTISAGSGTTAGATPGKLTTGAQTWSDGSGATPAGAYAIKFATTTTGNSTGSTIYNTEYGGTGGNFDLLSMPSLTVTSMGGSKFNLNLLGSPTNFTPGANYDWVVAEINNSTTYSGASDLTPGSANIALNTTGFESNSLSSGQFHWDFESFGSGSALHVKYNGAPEPVSFGLGLVGAVPLLLSRRRKRSAGPACNGR